MSNSLADSKEKGSLFWRISKKFQFAADKIIPDSFVFCLVLTLIVFALGMVFTGNGPLSMVKHWYNGFWTQMTFAFQMAFMVVTCAAAAKAKQVKKILIKIASIPKTPVGAMILLMGFGYVSSFINWAFCTVVTPILAMQLSKQVKGLHFPMMVAAGYSTMILGQCLGPSASVYALVATDGHFLADKIGVLNQAVTVYNPMNVTLFTILAVFTIVLSILTRPPQHEIVEYKTALDGVEEIEAEEVVTLADRMNGSKIMMYLIGFAGLAIIVTTFMEKGFLGALNINFVIFLFVILNTFLYNSPRKFVEAYKDNMKLATEIMMQFPFYGGIAGMMVDSGFGTVVVNGIMNIASGATMPVWAYISASVVNLFIPSQGGQWIVQGPLLVDAAQSLDANIPHVINAFVYGDEATNLLQPLYVIPALSVVGMKLKDVWGFMAFIWAFWTIITMVGLIVIPLLV
ncbi:short-chain fatty acid transporter [Geosporobacter ferrireducens]|uniref:Serine--pyruvate aminotransferase n=1 Tax=Geosporobacter ferrireducens TaxID=1424294 RepID=A0A1D8GQ22_9FIRM|nr:TIGR00366 family protein [Geosporobacter ferrireducens]AOT73062.1 serine--pyruvate aminotransferase [Geosporobacter ferrireducens]MTI54475.1 short-chain fatty acid transporter [Geosporobacter ferrireducens]